MGRYKERYSVNIRTQFSIQINDTIGHDQVRTQGLRGKQKWYMKGFLRLPEEEMPISHKIGQYRALLGFAHPGEVPWSSERGWGSCAQAGNMAGFYAPNSGWLLVGARDWSL